MHIAWATDLHLDSVDELRALEFCDAVNGSGASLLVLTGDLAIAKLLNHWLNFLREHIQIPIHFVLGNHDYYGSSVPVVRKAMVELSRSHEDLAWLGCSGVVKLTEKSGLVGHDGWGDGGYGDFMSSSVELTDYWTIAELKSVSKEERLLRLNTLGELSANVIAKNLEQACRENYQYLVCATHVPPFQESCTHKGKVADDNWAPHFSCKAVGDVLLQIAKNYPDREFLILAGHTHDRSVFQPLPNLTVHTGAAQYTEPNLQSLRIVVP